MDQNSVNVSELSTLYFFATSLIDTGGVLSPTPLPKSELPMMSSIGLGGADCWVDSGLGGYLWSPTKATMKPANAESE